MVQYHICILRRRKNWYLGVEQGEGGWQGWGLWDGAGDDHARGGGLDQDRLQQLDQQVVGEHVDSKGCFKTCAWNYTSTWTFTRVLAHTETVPVLVSWKLVLKTPALQMSRSKEEQLSFTWTESPEFFIDKYFTCSASSRTSDIQERSPTTGITCKCYDWKVWKKSNLFLESLEWKPSPFLVLPLLWMLLQLLPGSWRYIEYLINHRGNQNTLWCNVCHLSVWSINSQIPTKTPGMEKHCSTRSNKLGSRVEPDPWKVFLFKGIIWQPFEIWTINVTCLNGPFVYGVDGIAF